MLNLQLPQQKSWEDNYEFLEESKDKRGQPIYRFRLKPESRIRSKYMPHQGKKECARRIRQMT